MINFMYQKLKEIYTEEVEGDIGILLIKLVLFIFLAVAVWKILF